MNDSTGRRVILAAAVATLAIGSASAEDEVIVNASRAAASSANVGGVSAYRNPLAPPAADSAVAEPRSSVLGGGVRAGTGASTAPSPRAFGSFGIPFTSTRVSAGPSTSNKSNPNFLATTFPYRAVGKLLFSQGYCSASVILRSVIVTAAHCIQTFGSGAAIFTNHRFIPAHYQPGKTEALRAPYGTWTWAALARPASWADGTDTGSGAARDNDLAVIVLAKDASGRFIGDVTGKLSGRRTTPAMAGRARRYEPGTADLRR